MKKLTAVLSLSATVPFPSVSQAFILHTPRFNAGTGECSVVSAGNMNLVANAGLYGDDAVRTQNAYRVTSPGESVWIRTSGLTYQRCHFGVRAQSPGKPATSGMVRAAVNFTDSSGEVFGLEARWQRSGPDEAHV